jgi:hypothetical protein
VASSFTDQGGLRIGGQSEFTQERPPGCDLEVSEDGLIVLLDVLTAKFGAGYKAGLFRNDVKPTQETSLSEFEECNFSGYQGLVLLTGWSAATLNGVRADAQAGPVRWVHDGGPMANWVWGYYVVNADGLLVWAQRFCPVPLLLDSEGQTVRVLPSFTLRNEAGLEG